MPKLSQADVPFYGGKLSISEYYKSLQFFQNNKSPGNAHFTCKLRRVYLYYLSLCLDLRAAYPGDITHYKHSMNFITKEMYDAININLLYISATMPTPIVPISLGIMCICLSKCYQLAICCLSGLNE